MAQRKQGSMDPDRYQMRDLKRRITKLEKQNDHRVADIARLSAALRKHLE